MKTERNILIAFILNLSFSILEFFGGFFTGSIAILSDSVHDLGDAASIGISYFLEKKSKQRADENYTYGYARFSVLGGLITTVILAVGSILVIINAVKRLISPVDVNYNGMILFAVVGVVLNFAAAMITRKGDSINQKSVNLHMLEDVLGWAIVLAGAVIMKFTDIRMLDPLMSIGVAVFILFHTIGNLKEIWEVFSEKTPTGVDMQALKERIAAVSGVDDVHHIHVWSMDGSSNYATMHIVSSGESDIARIKADIRDILLEYHIVHSVLETEAECCEETECSGAPHEAGEHHHHHHHH